MPLVQDPPQHPLLRFAAELDGALDRAHQSDPVFLTPAERRDLLLSLHRSANRITALLLRVHAASVHDDVAQAGAFRDTADYIGAESGQDAHTVKKIERLGVALDERWQVLGTALREGRVSTAQADVIVDGLHRLPADIGPEIIDRAEITLVGLAGKHAPRELRRLTKRILEIVAPDLADEQDARLLEAEERRARDALALHVIRNADGVTGLSKIIWKAPDAAVDRLLTYLDAYSSPRHQAAAGHLDIPDGAIVPGSPASGERLPGYAQRGLAMLTLLEHLDPAKLPRHGGTATSLIVTIDHDVLTGKLGTAGLLNGDRITAAEARRLACNAGILPAILDGKGHVLDLGRSKRYFTAAQVTAMRLRDKRCRAEGCSMPAEYCEAHHKKAWRDGGKTNLEDGVLLCPFHHHRIEDDRYLHEYLPNGDVRFTRRT